MPMKTGLLFLAALLYAGSALPPLHAESITAQEAKKHVGENATVCGRIASERKASNSKGQPTFINLDAAYPNQIFTALVWGEDRARVGELPGEGARLCVQGVIADYKGIPQIVVRDKNQITR